MHFGSAPADEQRSIQYGICRSLGPTAKLGALIFNGGGVGDCIIPAEVDGDPPTVLHHGGMDIIQARDLGPGRSDDPQQAMRLSSELKVKLDTFLLDEDRAMIANISGHSYESLEKGVLALPSSDLEKVLSNVRFLMHDLNLKGLTMLRHILAERMYKARQEASGATNHPDFETFQREGFLMKDLDKLSSEEVVALLRMASGEESLGIPNEVSWDARVTLHSADDPQYDKHIDNAVGPVFKVWVYPGDLTMAEGPLHYSRGSHRSAGGTAHGKLRWMHESTVPPATEAMREPALRMHGDETAFGLEAVAPLLPIPNVTRTLVLADVSGIHHRGWAAPGTQRRGWRPAGDNAGGLPRLDPFREVTACAVEERP